MKKTCLPAGRAALFDPYLDTLGGGEKYILSILKVLNDEGYEITVFWNEKKILEKIKKTFSLQFNIKLEQWSQRDLKKFDYFFYVTDGSYFFSTAKKNFIYAMVPQKNLYNLNLINRLKTWNYRFISHSKFTQRHLEKWGIKSEVVYPWIETTSVGTSKDKVILTVGRFFKHLHTKRQDLAIKFFKDLKLKSEFEDYKLILAGGLKKEDQDYYDELKKLAGGNPSIIFEPNISRFELDRLYRLSAYYWHFSGFGIDEVKNPELVEHMGITSLEAISYGAIPFCFAAGGPKEIIKDGENGFLFKSGEELIKKMSKIVSDENLQNEIRSNGKKFIKENFSYKLLRERVKKIL